MNASTSDPRQLANQQIADSTGASFSFSGPSYGMGGYYTGLKTSDDPEWDSSDESGWMASSQSC
jgi:hypothetical protein